MRSGSEKTPRIIALPTVHTSLGDKVIAEISHRLQLDRFDAAYFEADLGFLEKLQDQEKIASLRLLPNYDRLLVTRLFTEKEVAYLEKLTLSQGVKLKFNDSLHLVDLVSAVSTSINSKLNTLQRQLYDHKLVKATRASGTEVQFLDYIHPINELPLLLETALHTLKYMAREKSLKVVVLKATFTRFQTIMRSLTVDLLISEKGAEHHSIIQKDLIKSLATMKTHDPLQY